MQFKNLLFDLDGTLTDSAPGITKCIRYALRRLELPDVEDHDLRWTLGPPLAISFERLLSTSDEIRVQLAIDFYRERFTTVGWKENSVYDGIPQILDSLSKKRLNLFVATSKPRVFAERILDHFGHRRFFTGIYGSELDGERSNKGALLGHLLEVEGLDRNECLMIGDREHDAIGAKANGIVCLGVTYGYGTREELLAAGALHVVDTPADIARFVLDSSRYPIQT